MFKNFLISIIASFIIGILVGSVIMNQFVIKPTSGLDYVDTVQHVEYHIHADFYVYIENEKIELNLDELMTTAEQSLHEHAHLHDDNGEIIHMHEEGITLVEFLDSLDIQLTDDCLSILGEKEYCETSNKELTLYVNDAIWQGSIVEYIPHDEDQILLYFGDLKNIEIQNYIDAVPDEACIYSGTCLERGVAPPESCGLTCAL